MFASAHPGVPAPLRPATLRAGDRAVFVAPASPFERERFERGVKAVASLGLEVAFGEGLFARHPPGGFSYLAGDDARRAEELRLALEDPAARVLVLARGGYGALRLVHAIDPGLVARGNKLLLGYSDATVLHEVWARAGVASIHGPMSTQLGEEPSALERLRALLFGEDPGPLTWTPPALPGLPGGPAEGVLRGGNLATLGSMCGTPLQPRFSGCLALLEDLNEAPYRLDRLCTQLLLSGALDGARGIVVGDLVGAGEDSGGRLEVLAERFAPLGIPVVFGAPFGHAGRNQPVAFGCRHRLDPAGSLTQLEAPTAAPAAPASA